MEFDIKLEDGIPQHYKCCGAGKALFAILFCILICVLAFSCKTQEKFIRETGTMIGVDNDTLNQFDDNGDMTGYWLEYLKSDLKLAKKNSEITYIFYAYYWNGKKVLPMSSLIRKSPSVRKMDEKGDTNLYGYPLISGTFKVVSNNLFNRFRFQIEYNEGHYMRWDYYGKNGKLLESVDYRKTYLGFPITCTIIGYDEGFLSTAYYYGLINNEIKMIPAKRADSIPQLPREEP